ncbi:TraR/DksA family transcriptional regulator [Ruania suaedae]|uniref:TraR/DksA family transcriptional regulator n=1 Tax=Ruania suaedae TaxID=2897774 RepID=UPI001E36AC63|nr:TraR/DksA C4-type zinc finger protein [Ruania suaedae]UFU04051.1 TraR/DksA family transcriptional regulator [Ruania suaedae]
MVPGGEDLAREGSGAEIAELLAAEAERTRVVISSLQRNLGVIIDGARSTATDDEHDPEGSTIAFERSQASALLASATARLAEIEEAQQRIREGGYGICERCGSAIPAGRLRARPTARTCVACA